MSRNAFWYSYYNCLYKKNNSDFKNHSGDENNKTVGESTERLVQCRQILAIPLKTRAANGWQYVRKIRFRKVNS